MPYERIVNIALLDRDFDIEQGELTPKGSFRRKQVVENFSTVIDELYVGTSSSFACPGLTVRVPRWFFRDLGVLETDNIECAHDGLHDKVRDRFLSIRESPATTFWSVISNMKLRVMCLISGFSPVSRCYGRAIPPYLRFAPARKAGMHS